MNRQRKEHPTIPEKTVTTLRLTREDLRAGAHGEVVDEELSAAEAAIRERKEEKPSALSSQHTPLRTAQDAPFRTPKSLKKSKSRVSQNDERILGK